jgi:hypothetical protein
MVAADPSQKTTYHPPSIISSLLDLFMYISAPNDVQKQINKTYSRWVLNLKLILRGSQNDFVILP